MGRKGRRIDLYIDEKRWPNVAKYIQYCDNLDVEITDMICHLSNLGAQVEQQQYTWEEEL